MAHPDRANRAQVPTARIVIERGLDDGGRDCVWVGTDKLSGTLGLVEALGLLAFAAFDIIDRREQ